MACEKYSLSYFIRDNPSDKNVFRWTPDTLERLDCLSPEVISEGSIPEEASAEHGQLRTCEEELDYAERAYDRIIYSERKSDHEDSWHLLNALVGSFKDSEGRCILRGGSKSLLLYLGKKAASRVPIPLLICDGTGLPVAASIDHSSWRDITQRFDTIFDVRKENRDPFGCKYWPCDETSIHPYHVCIMIAMAQRIMRVASKKHKKELESAKVHFFAPSIDAKSMILYSAEISQEYLKKFKEPAKFTDAQLHITSRQVHHRDLEDLNKVKDLFLWMYFNRQILHDAEEAEQKSVEVPQQPPQEIAGSKRSFADFSED
ncbi:hypothetical protein F5884DRAFT_762026 [Xylogone sp. PMI_703]|nr:hypothetical protein F5884DRAFT_762026 [Xylogone sp. PMI_703]